MSADADRALELRRAGVPASRIQEQLGLAELAEVEALVMEGLRASGLTTDPVLVRDLELDRLDRIHQSVFLKAVKGDLAAVDRVMKLAEIRMRISGAASVGQSIMVAAYDETVAELDLSAVDASLVAAGRRLAEKIDSAAAGIDPLAETKALYLVPHLMNVLRELGATPAARAAAKAAAPELPAAVPGDAEEVPVDLNDWKSKRGGNPA
jgi:hypothetical protein